MRKSRFTDAQTAFFIRPGEESTPVDEISGKAGISPATYFNRKKYTRLMPSEMRRDLEAENACLKQIVTDRYLDKEMLQDVIKRKLGGLP